LFAFFERGTKKFSEGLHKVGAVFVAIIFIGVLINVILRFLGIGLVGVDEFAELLNIWVCFLAAPFVFRAGRHIRVDLVTCHVSPSAVLFAIGG